MAPVFGTRRIALCLIEVCLLLGITAGVGGGGSGVKGGERKKSGGSSSSREIVPCPHSKCQCKPDKRGDIVAKCVKVSERLPEFHSVNVTFGELILSNRGLTELPERGFRGVRTKTLDIGNNPLNNERISERAFDGLEEVLEKLWLSDCGLTTVPVASLSALAKLKILHLEDNSISEIPARFLSGHEQLQEIYLNRNGITSIDKDAFVKLKGLRQLKLGQNRVPTLPAKLFKALTNLTGLDLSHNLIHALVPGTFEGLRSLRWLELESNLITVLNQDTFRGARKLKNMKIESNQLTTIGNNAFKTIGNLGYLSIDITRVRPLTADTFAGLEKLETLNIGEFPVSGSLPDRFFASMRRLKRLSLFDNAGKFAGLRKDMFGAAFPFKKLSVFARPLRSCRCSEPWIRSMNGLGTYIHGHCADSRLLSCVATTKNATKNANADRFRDLTVRKSTQRTGGQRNCSSGSGGSCVTSPVATSASPRPNKRN